VCTTNTPDWQTSSITRGPRPASPRATGYQQKQTSGPLSKLLVFLVISRWLAGGRNRISLIRNGDNEWKGSSIIDTYTVLFLGVRVGAEKEVQTAMTWRTGTETVTLWSLKPGSLVEDAAIECAACQQLCMTFDGKPVRCM
jgi:hypothetical protein